MNMCYDGKTFENKTQLKQYVFEIFDKIYKNKDPVTMMNDNYNKLTELLRRHPDYMTKYYGKPINSFTFKLIDPQKPKATKKVYDLLLNDNETIPWTECITQTKRKKPEKKEQYCPHCNGLLPKSKAKQLKKNF